MAERRMFTKKIIDSDAFLEMPCSAQALYFHLCMRADDDGFVNNPQKIRRVCGASGDDLKLLMAKRFILTFENGIIVIKHWRMHNLLRKDRYTPTQYIEEKESLMLKADGAYTERTAELPPTTEWQPNGNQVATQYSIGKESIVKDSIGKDRVGEGNTPSAPTLEAIEEYVFEHNLNVDAKKFYDYYNSRGWQTAGGNTFDWKAKLKEWSDSEKPKKGTGSNPFLDILKNGGAV